MTEPYRERGCARRRSLLFFGLVAPLAFVVVAVVGIAEDQVLISVVAWAALLVCLILPTKVLMQNWPSGISVDSIGISVGAVGRRARSVVAPTTQPHGRFRLAWTDVSRVDVIDTKAGLAALWALRSSVAGTKPTKLRRGPYSAGQGFSFVEGLLLVWGMRAALVITLRDPDAGERPAYRSVRGQGHVRRAVWAAPTRRPGELRDALARAGHPARATLDSSY